VADLLPGQQAAHHLDALAQPGVADVLARPDLAGDVLVARLAGAERAQNRPGYIALSVAAAWAMIAGW
jgi:hypothetical protein